jgi:2-polyprenyl-3-methyl-5-hydroxy-6-metoxy-1,4-benzoquinol methylase
MRDLNAEHKDTTRRRYAYDFDWILRKYLLMAISPYFAAGDKALELGCYQGDMTEQILSYFNFVTVIEGSSELCQIVAKRFPSRVGVINATFEEAKLEAKFDAIFLVHTLEHLDDPVGVLSKIKHWLTLKGRLFIAVPNANALSRQIAVRMGLVQYNTAVTSAEREHGHRMTYTMDQLEYHIREAGLRAVHSGGVLVKPLANFQFDKALEQGIIDQAYLDGCYELSKLYPDLCASLYAVCEAG